MNLDIVILAAGKGTRMKSSKPKVMQEFIGRPFIERVINTAKELNPNKIIPIIGYRADEIKNYFFNQQLDFVIQEQQLGTGHAVMQAIKEITSQFTLILYGDVPLIKKELLLKLTDASKKTGIGLVTFDKSVPNGFGRIVRDGNKQKIYLTEALENINRAIKLQNPAFLSSRDSYDGRFQAIRAYVHYLYGQHINNTAYCT